MKHIIPIIFALSLSACSTLGQIDTYQYISAENQAAFDAYIQTLVASQK